MKSDTCVFSIGARVKTLHGPGTVRRIESWAWPGDVTHYANKQEEVPGGQHTYRYGVLHDVFPEKFRDNNPTDNLLYYRKNQLEVIDAES
jgi:hypothetical protein